MYCSGGNVTWHDAAETGTKALRGTCATPSSHAIFSSPPLDEGVSIQIALGKVIRAMGVKEFAEQAEMASPNVLRAINPRHNPTQATLNRLLKPLRLRLSLARLDGPRRRHAA